MPSHTVAQGECLSSIADQYGLFWRTIWTHSNNGELRRQRKNPNVLMPGDVLFVPDKRPKEESCVTTKRHEFRIKGIPTRFNVVMLDDKNQPIANARYTLDIDGTQYKGTTADDGKVSKPVSPKARQATLTIHSEDPEEDDRVYRFALRHLNPVDKTTGLKARLKSLGFYRGEIDDEIDDATREGIRKFQESVGLEITGESDSSTMDRLVQLYGS